MRPRAILCDSGGIPAYLSLLEVQIVSIYEYGLTIPVQSVKMWVRGKATSYWRLSRCHHGGSVAETFVIGDNKSSIT